MSTYLSVYARLWASRIKQHLLSRAEQLTAGGDRHAAAVQPLAAPIDLHPVGGFSLGADDLENGAVRSGLSPSFPGQTQSEGPLVTHDRSSHLQLALRQGVLLLGQP